MCSKKFSQQDFFVVHGSQEQPWKVCQDVANSSRAVYLKVFSKKAADQQDGAPAHISMHSREYLVENRITEIDEAPKSLDVNSLETLWRRC